MHITAKISAMYNQGRLYAEQGHYKSAIAAYHRALEQRPDYYPPQSIYNLLGKIFHKIRNSYLLLLAVSNHDSSLVPR